MRLMTATSPRTARRRVGVEPHADLSTDRVVLRPLGYADRGAFLDAFERSRTGLRRWFPIERSGETPGAYFERLVDLGVRGDRDGSSCRRGVFTHAGALAGMVNLIKIDRGMSWSAEINVWIDAQRAGQGLGADAAGAMVEHALKDLPIGLGLHEVRAFVCLDNGPSVRLFERLGFARTGATEMLDINDALVRHHLLVRRASVRLAG